jgi:hypothetical protein
MFYVPENERLILNSEAKAAGQIRNSKLPIPYYNRHRNMRLPYGLVRSKADTKVC